MIPNQNRTGPGMVAAISANGTTPRAVSTAYDPGQPVLVENLRISFARGRMEIATLDGSEPPRIRREGKTIYLTGSAIPASLDPNEANPPTVTQSDRAHK